jgi:hypothetical protein
MKNQWIKFNVIVSLCVNWFLSSLHSCRPLVFRERFFFWNVFVNVLVLHRGFWAGRSHRKQRIFLYLICHDFRKIIRRIKIFEKCKSDAGYGVRILPPYRTTLGVLPPRATAAGETPTVGRWGQYLTPRPMASGNPSARGHGVRKLLPWAAASAPPYIRGRDPCRQPPPPSLLLSNLRPFQPLRSASKLCFLNLVRFS